MAKRVTSAGKPSFVRPSEIEGEPADMWAVPESGDWSADNAAGRRMAEECVAHIRETGQPQFLGHVTKAMCSKGRHGGVEVGFFAKISEILLFH
jgi:hypothetical protein